MNAVSPIEPVNTDEERIAAAIATAAADGRPALDVLEETSGLGPAELAAVLGRLTKAALADEEGKAMEREIAALTVAAATHGRSATA